MAIDLQMGTPLAEALQNVVQPKLVEMGWSTGGLDDNALAEYILLMLVNGKPQDAIASELSNDLLGLRPEDSGAIDFARWLFQQVETLSGRTSHTGEQMNTPQTSSAQAAVAQDTGVFNVTSQDTDMDGTTEHKQDENIPTGPKSMRNGVPKARDKRMLGQMNKAMDRTSDASLHRIKGAAGGAGRIDSHAGRESSKKAIPTGPRSLTNRPQAPQQPKLVNSMPLSPVVPTPFGTLTPQQQMQLMVMYEEQARMMAQIFSPQQAQQTHPVQTGSNGNGLIQPPQQPGKSLFERVQNKSRRQATNIRRPHIENGKHASQMPPVENGNSDTNLDLTSSMEVETSSQSAVKTDPSTTICKYNKSCTKPDCPFVHQSPVAPPGITIDMEDTCTFGAACQNFKCVGKHPSPALRNVHKSEQECKFYPNCTNPTCPFRHPTMPPCRNGADCSIPGCKFSHTRILCKFNPCLNPTCPFKHREGQKGVFHDKVWINPEEGVGDGGSPTEHVSERKFVDDDGGEEELILPGKNGPETVTEIAT